MFSFPWVQEGVMGVVGGGEMHQNNNGSRMMSGRGVWPLHFSPQIH
jgi:hypothetical protein